MRRLELELRKRGITQVALAESAGIHRVTINRFLREKQDPSFEPGRSAERIARALDWQEDAHALFEEVE